VSTPMIIFRFVLGLGVLLTAACGKKQDTATPAPVVKTQEVAVASSETNHAPATNAVAATNTPSVKPVARAGQEQYEQGLALMRRAQNREELDASVKLFRESAELGNAVAQHALGVCYFTGIGVAKNPDEAMAWLNKSAAQGNADAQFKVASVLIRGDGVPADEAKALEMLRAAADQGHAEAQYNLATLYATGKTAPKDPKEAADWYRKAAESGHPIAQSNLGVLHASGQLGQTNMDEAVRWWKKGAEQGQPSAMFNLAQALVEGKSVEKDLVEAYKWSNLAADQGDPDAARLRSGIATEISPSELGEALKRSRVFKAELQNRRTEQREKLF
jgi:TPR repeat protein